MWLFVAGPPAVQASSPKPSDAPPNSPSTPIVVTAPPRLVPGEKPSAWKRVDADHVVVYSDGSDEQLQHIAANLEKMHDLLARLYRPSGRDDEPARLEVVLFATTGALRNLRLSNPRFEEGPYAGPFAEQRYHDPRAEGSVLALPRVGQIVKLQTSKARVADCEDAAAGGKDCLDMFPPPYNPPITRSWEALLYGAYAQHLVLNYAPVAYPRWYVDGIGALFSTVVFKRDGSLEYGRPPQNYRLVLRSYGLLDTAGVLTGEYLRNPSMRMDWTPYHAWLLTHFFVFSDVRDKERAQFSQYMVAIAHGKSPAEAAQAFGKMTRLRRAVMIYAGGHHEFAVTAPGEPEPPLPVVSLSQPAAEALLASLAQRPRM